MGRVLAVQRSAIGQSTWTVDEDSLIVALTASVNAIISRDKNDTLTGGIVTGVNNKIIAIILSTGTSIIVPSVPVYSGEQIYCDMSAAGSVVFSLTEPETIQL
jgi:hypothetical protein